MEHGEGIKLVNHLETKEFIIYALEAAVDQAVEKWCRARYPEEKQKHLDDKRSLRRCIEIISSLSEADILCAPAMD